MKLFDFFKRKTKASMPDVYPSVTPVEIAKAINSINWVNFETAYGNAEKTIPFYLHNLFATDISVALDATHQLWCSLCHQHAYVSSASLPAYPILKTALLQLNEPLKIEILDIFQGFAYCTSATFNNGENELTNWMITLRQLLQNDIELFKHLSKNTNEEIADFATHLVDSLEDDHRKRDIYQLQKGKTYRVIKPFTDFDGIFNPIGKEWIFEEINYLPYDAGLSLFVVEHGQRTQYRFWDSPEGQERLLQTFMNYVAQC